MDCLWARPDIRAVVENLTIRTIAVGSFVFSHIAERSMTSCLFSELVGEDCVPALEVGWGGGGGGDLRTSGSCR